MLLTYAYLIFKKTQENGYEAATANINSGVCLYTKIKKKTVVSYRLTRTQLSGNEVIWRSVWQHEYIHSYWENKHE